MPRMILFAILCASLSTGFAVSAFAEKETPESFESFHLDDMVVTGTSTEQLLCDVTVRTQLVASDAIAAMGSLSLADAVEFTPGVRVLNGCQNCNFTTLSLLGLEGKYTQILFDGRPTYSGLSLVYGLEQIPAEMVDRIEIVKGGGSSIYGPGAVGGVVNVIPHDPHADEVHARVRYADMDGAAAWKAGFGGEVVSDDGASGLTFFGTAGHADPYDRNGDDFTEIARLRSTAFGGRFVRHAGDAGRLTLDFGRIYEDRRGGDRIDSPPTHVSIAEWIRSTRTSVGLDWRDRIGENTEYVVGTAYAHTHRETYYGADGDPDAFGLSRNPLWIVDGQVNHLMNDHMVSVGVQHSRDNLVDEHLAHGRTLDKTYTNTGIFIQDDWIPVESLNLVVGTRLDAHSELDDPVVSPRAALRWRAGDAVTLRGSVSTGFLAPQTFDEDLHIAIAGGEPQVITNADDLKEERSRSYAFGLEAMPAIGGGFGLFEVNVFRTDLTDAFSLTDEFADEDADVFEFRRINVGGAVVQGAEVTVGYMQGRLESQVGVVRQIGEYDDPQDFDSREFFRLPETSGVARLYWRDPSFADVFVGLRHIGEMKVPHYAGDIEEDRLETSDTFLTLDVSVSKQFAFGGEEIGLTLGGNNLTDAYQDDFDTGAERDPGYVYGPRRPRTWFARMEYGF